MLKLWRLYKYFDMRCPHCHRKLILGIERKFENSEDHCFDPNMETHPLRKTFECVCELKNLCFWDENGGAYIMKFDDFEKIIPYPKNSNALFSWDWWYWNFDTKIFWFRRNFNKLFLNGEEQ